MRCSSFVFLAIFAALPSCWTEVPSTGESWSLTEESGEDLENVPAVARFRLSGGSGMDLEDIWLVSGDVSSVSQGKLQRGEVPDTIAEHRQPLVSWMEDADVVLAPTSILEPSERYSFVALGVGLLGSFLVSEEERPLFRLLGEPWATTSGEVIYCLDHPGADAGVLLAWGGETGFSAGVSEQGGGTASCVRTPFGAERGFFLPPASIDEFLFEPTPVFRVEQPRTIPPTTPGTCRGQAALAFLGGCAEPAPGAVLVHLSPGYFALSLLSAEGATVLERVVVARENEIHALGPLRVGTAYHLEVTRFTPGGSSDDVSTEEIEFESGDAAPRFVLTELLADPLGNEPESEWVEVANIGTGAGSLEELELWDSSGGVALPDVVLEPGMLGLIVRPDFSFLGDEVPHAASVPVVVASLGENGLRNSGEEVSLRSPEGRVLSMIVPMGTRAGESVARLDPWAPDIPSSFSRLSPPTPGSL